MDNYLDKISQPAPLDTATSPALPKPKSPLSDFYVLWYIKNIPHTEFIVFEAPSLSMPEVIAQGKNYCEIMRYRFLHVRPLVMNLKAEMLRERPSIG